MRPAAAARKSSAPGASASWRRSATGVAVLAAAPELVKSRDTEIPYRQNSDFFYLTGFLEPGAVAVLTPHDDEHRFTLFVRPRDPERETWSGMRAGVEGARERFGADAAYPVDRAGRAAQGAGGAGGRAVVRPPGRRRGDGPRMLALLAGFRGSRPRSGKGPWDLRDPAQLLDRMRMIKEPGEIALMREAAELAARGHLAAMRAGRPGVGEWEIQALLDSDLPRPFAPDSGHLVPRHRGLGGQRHHPALRHQRRGASTTGELVLVDAGAEVGFYCADITRIFPASGRFTAAAARRVRRRAAARWRPPSPPCAPARRHQRRARGGAAGAGGGDGRAGAAGGRAWKLIEEEKPFKRFFMHNTSHWLGLDVHDAGALPRARPASRCRCEPGMVLTVEPGLYIPADADDVPARAARHRHPPGRRRAGDGGRPRGPHPRRSRGRRRGGAHLLVARAPVGAGLSRDPASV